MEKNNKILIVAIIIIYLLINAMQIVQSACYYSKNNYSYIRDILEYTDANKDNVYLYSTALNDIYLSYSVYEKVEDNSLANIRSLSDWDIYNAEYYNFKEKYGLTNIINDLYENDNVYLITGNVRTAMNTIYDEHPELIKQYIKQHYNQDVDYKIIKEFDNSIKVYKFYKIDNNEGEN